MIGVTMFQSRFMVRTVTLYFSVFLATIAAASADTYPEVLFENSVLSGSYMHSQVHYDGLSWVENVKGRLPVSDSVFFTPGNALSLKYTSSSKGDWHVGINYADSSRYYHPKNGDVLAFKLFVVSNTHADMLPKLVITQEGNSESTLINLASYISDFQSNMWLNVKIPLADVAGLHLTDAICGIRFEQGGADDGTHWLYVDQVEFLPASPPSAKLSSPAVLTTAKAYDRHVDLTWQLPLTPSIRYIKIYRSEDNQQFEPVAIRPVFVQKGTDFVPYSNKTYYYKIAWVDYDYLESPFSGVLKAETKTAGDEELLDFIQAAHVNYFMERVEVNSGMHAISFGIDDATVSVKETGLSILAYIVAAKRGFVSHSVITNRLVRILGFLEGVEKYNGAFPALLDGRTGNGIFAIDSVPEGDVKATAFLMQGLLAAQQYIVGAGEGADSLTEKINAVWNGIEWNRFTIGGQEGILLDRWSPVVGFKDALPLGGFGDDFIGYLLALASPEHAIPPVAYEEGLGVPRELVDDPVTMELVENQLFSVNIQHEEDTIIPQYQESTYTNDTTLYGLDIRVGSIDESLLEAYQPFLAFDPRNKKDKFADYYANNINLTKAYQRRDNERGCGISLDLWGCNALSDTLEHPALAINPAIACASYGYIPEEAVRSIRTLYNDYGNVLFTEYGFRKWMSSDADAIADEYDSLNQAAAVVMIENGRSGLIWELFSNHPDIKKVIENHFVVE